MPLGACFIHGLGRMGFLTRFFGGAHTPRQLEREIYTFDREITEAIDLCESGRSKQLKGAVERGKFLRKNLNATKKRALRRKQRRIRKIIRNNKDAVNNITRKARATWLQNSETIRLL